MFSVSMKSLPNVPGLSLTKLYGRDINNHKPAGGDKNTAAASVNEILVGWYIKPGTKSKPFSNYHHPTAVHNKFGEYANQLSNEEYINQMGRAQAMADVFLAWAKTMKYSKGDRESDIEMVYWTAQALSSLTNTWGHGTKIVPIGGTGANPTDTLVKFKCGKTCGWLGMSAKSTKKYIEVPFTNPGLGTISTELWGNSAKLYGVMHKHYNAMLKDKPLMAVLDAATIELYPKTRSQSAPFKSLGTLAATDDERSVGGGKRDAVFKFLIAHPTSSKAAALASARKKRKPAGWSDDDCTYRKNGKLYYAYEDGAVGYGTKVISEIRDTILNKLAEKPKTEPPLWEIFLLNFVGSEWKGPMYVKVTGRGEFRLGKGKFEMAGGDAGRDVGVFDVSPKDEDDKDFGWMTPNSIGNWHASLEHPGLNKKVEGLLLDHIYLNPGDGHTSITVEDVNEHSLFGVRIKWAGRAFATSIKLSGDSKGTKDHFWNEQISQDGKMNPKKSNDVRANAKIKRKTYC
jgi:hypothetical protein